MTGWEDGSLHHLHFFVANRQTEISDFSMSLPSSFAVDPGEIAGSGESDKKGDDDENCVN